MQLIFTDPRFRLVWLAGVAANVSGFTFWVVQGWLTLTVTDSPFWLGTAVGIGGLGMVLFSIPGGVLADSADRRKVAGFSMLASGVVVAILAAPTFAHSERLWQILAASFLLGATGALSAPAFTALTLDVVGRRKLLSANAANFAALGLGGAAMPVAAAFIVDSWGAEWALTVAAVSFALGAGFLLTLPDLDPVATPAETRGESRWKALRRGTTYVFTTAHVRALILMGLVGEMFGWAHIWMLPAMARDVLGSGVNGFGYLASAGFGGLLVATVAISSLGDVRHKGRLLVGGGIGFGFFIILFATSRSFPLSVVLLATAYGLGTVYELSLGTLVQTVVPDHMRGRVISFQALTWGANGLSGFHTGAIAERLGAPWAVAIGAIVMLAYVLGLAPHASRLEEHGGEGPMPGAQEP